MSEVVIKVENLSKRYLIGHQRQGSYLTLRDTMAQKARDWGKRLAHPFRASSGQPLGDRSTTEEFWALKDVSFEIKQGDRVGIIGRNGAGKSTLLKLLSRITEPTSGRITLNGRVASLLEVGTGFHPELTGRENIFLNGAVLGMTRAEIRRKFEEIVAFAEVEQFLDTPVKRYSSGMYVRLAFAVAAHLEPEILIVDEVLAVGDAQFQKKCLGKMEEVGREGRTVLFVSHQMEAIAKLCNNALLLEVGEISQRGPTAEVIPLYLEKFFAQKRTSLEVRQDRSGEGRVRFTDSWTEDKNGKHVSTFLTGDSIKIGLAYQIEDNEFDIKDLKASLSIFSAKNSSISLLSNYFTGDMFPDSIPSKGFIECLIPKIPLNEGNYYYNISLHSRGGLEDWVQEAGVFQIVGGDFYGTGRMPDRDRMILIDHNWQLTI